MVARVPIIEQCAVSSRREGDFMIEDLATYLQRNKNLVFPHRHNFYHFLLFTKGGGKHSIDFESYEVVPWQIYFMSPGQIHTWSFEGAIEGFVVNFDSDFFKTFLLRPDHIHQFSFFSGLVRDSVFVVKEELREAIIDVFSRLQQNVQDLAFVRVALLYLFHLLEGSRDHVQTFGQNIYNNTLLRNFLHLIELNYKKLRLPKEYAALLYITPNHLNALCKETLGVSAGEMIRGRILLEAKRLLVIRDYSVAEIAYALNFSDNSYFTKFFKKGEGVTPEEFRKQINDGK